MPSTLACLGLSLSSADALDDLLDKMPAEDHGSAGDVRILRHVDPGSGARVVLGVRDGEAVDLVPSLDAPVNALVARLVHRGEAVAADVVDPDSGEVVAQMVADLEQTRCLPSAGARFQVPDDVQFPASVVALGVEVSVHADEAAFREAQATERTDGTARGFAPQSFIAHAVLAADDAAVEPTAWLAGTALRTDTLTTEATGEQVHAVQVQTEGFVATVCLPASAVPEPPQPGAVVAGTCWMVLDVPALWSLDVGSLSDLLPSARSTASGKRGGLLSRLGRRGAARG